jgi:replicative DNA helicase
MAGFGDTVDLERSYLRIITKSNIMARLHARQAHEEWFSSEERRFIFSMARSTALNTKTAMSGRVFDYEVGRRIDPKEASHYFTEWNIIEATIPTEGPAVILDRMEEAAVGRKMMKAAESIVEKMEAGEVGSALQLFKQSAVAISLKQDASPVVEITDYERRLKTVRDKQDNPDKYMGIKTGFPTFDRHTGGLFPKELTLIAGVTGQGKSTLVRSLARGIILNNYNKNVLHIANEENLEQVEHKFDAALTKIPYHDFKFATISNSEIKEWTDYMDKDMKQPGRGRLFVREVPAFHDITLVEETVRELENMGIKIHVIIIDHLPHVKPIQPAWGENDERGKAASDCKELARWLECSVVIPTQAATEVEKKQQRGKRAGKMDVYGSKAQIHVANTFIIITYKGVDETQVDREEWERDVRLLADIKKNRDGPPFNFKLRHHVRIGLMEEELDAAAAALAAAAQQPVSQPQTGPQGVTGSQDPVPPKRQAPKIPKAAPPRRRPRSD